MNCHDVKQMLSEFADGMLPETEAAAVEEHLVNCADCSEAYETMSTIIRHMNRMEVVDEPDDFLEKVNARLDEPSFLARLIRRFFVPLRIKLPLELAGVAVAAAVVIYFAAISDRQSLYEITVTIDRRTDTGIVEKKSDKKGDEADHPGKRGAKGPTSLHSVIGSLEGRVIESKHREGTDILNYLIIEIPAGNYQLLLEELSWMGVVHEAPSRVSEDSDDVIRVKITSQ